MVTPEQKQQEAATAAAKPVGCGGKGFGLGGAAPSTGPSGDDPMRALVKATDVGKTVGSVVKSAGTGDQPYLGMVPKSALATGPGGTWCDFNRRILISYHRILICAIRNLDFLLKNVDSILNQVGTDVLKPIACGEDTGSSSYAL